MADRERIEARIAEIVARRNNVSLDEIEWVIRQLQQFVSVSRREGRHGILFRVGNQRFMVNHHNPGNKQVKPYSVDGFRDAMIELGWYEL